MQTKIVKESLNLVPEIMQVLEAGEVAILPTDTSYALVANAFNPEGLAKIARLKGWQMPKPLVLLTRKEKAEQFGVISPICARTLEHFPYPIILVVPKKESVPEGVTAGRNSLLISCPGKFVYDLIEQLPFPIAASSASLSEDLKVTTADWALRLFGGQVPLIVDGGKSKYGTNATLIDFMLERPTILNFGAVFYDDLQPLIPGIELPSHLRK
jgi:tRNA threonylcarbamoyl adenosine modification protein (Sua5/YciO/YrdC/YwlC family)